MAAGALAVRGIMRSSRNARVSITPTPTKSTFRRFPSTTSNPSSQKRRIPTRKGITKSQSENVLTSQFRTLSLTPNRQPPNDRARSATPKKSRPRGLSTVTTNSIVDIAKLIKEEKCRNIIIMAGAGISTPSGIPDFRTPGTGLYDNLQEYNIPEPTAIFDIEYFWYDPRPFFCLAKELYPGNFQPNYVHYFIKLLHDKGLLFRMYTQNIDGLERLVGIPSDKLVEAHGTFSSASCTRCRKTYDGDDIRKIILKGDIPRCQSSKCNGVIKPDIVFFGEDLPKRFYSFEDDFPKCDLLIVMGTSLEVEPFAGIVSEVSRSTPRLLINREAVGPFASPWRGRRNDVTLKGDVVSGIKRLVKLLEWNEEMIQIVTEGNENWKNKKELEMKEREEETSKKNEKPPHKPSGSTKTRGFHTMAGKSTQNSARQNSFLPHTLSQSKRKSDSETLSNSNQSNKTISGNGTSLTGNASLPGNSSSLPGHHGPRTTSTKQTLFACNSVARRAPLLPFRYTHRPPVETQGNFRTINPKSDLASAGFGHRGIKNSKGTNFYVESSSDSSDSSSSDSDSEG